MFCVSTRPTPRSAQTVNSTDSSLFASRKHVLENCTSATGCSIPPSSLLQNDDTTSRSVLWPSEATQALSADKAELEVFPKYANQRIESFEKSVVAALASVEKTLSSLASKVDNRLDKFELLLSATNNSCCKPSSEGGLEVIPGDCKAQFDIGSSPRSRRSSTPRASVVDVRSRKLSLGNCSLNSADTYPMFGISLSIKSSKSSKQVEHVSSEYRDSIDTDTSFASLWRDRLPSIAAKFPIFRITMERTLANSIWYFLEDPESTRYARWFARFWPPFVLCCALFSLVQSTNIDMIDKRTLGALELSFDSVFLLEILVRFLVCPNTYAFVVNPHNFLDVLGVFLIALRVPCLADAIECDGSETSAGAVLICATPLFRLLKALRYFKQFHLFITLFQETKEALSVQLLLLSIIVVAASSVVYIAEPRDNVGSLPTAMYLIIVTISTVGYGDVTPETTAGYLAVSIIIVGSVLYMAIPLGIIGNAFTGIWDDRDRILLTLKTRERLIQMGVTADNFEQLFNTFDEDGDGMISVSEFCTMVSKMRIGLDEQRAIKLFDTIDKDGSGCIDLMEFTKALCPSTYHELIVRNRD